MPSLSRAIALPQGNDATAAIAEDLHLDVAGVFDVLLEKYAAAPEILPGEPLDGAKGLRQFGFLADQLHANAATAGTALQHDGIADRAPRVRGHPPDPASRPLPGSSGTPFDSASSRARCLSPKSRI